MGIFPQVGLIAFVNGQVCLLQDTLESTWTSTTAATFLLGGGSGEASLWTLAITTTQSTSMERRSNMAPTTTRWVHGPWRISLVSVCRIRPKRVCNNTRFLLGLTVLVASISWTFNCSSGSTAPLVSVHDIVSVTTSSLTDCPLIKPLLYVHINSTKKWNMRFSCSGESLCKWWMRCWLISFCCWRVRTSLASDVSSWLQLLHKNSNLSNHLNIY